MKKMLAFLIGLFFITNCNSQVVQFITPNLNTSQKILLNHHYPEGEIKSVNINQLKSALNNSFINASFATLQLNSSISIQIEVKTIYQSSNTNNSELLLFIGEVDGNPNKPIRIRVDDNSVYLYEYGDEGPCYEIIYVNCSEHGIFVDNGLSYVSIKSVPCPDEPFNQVLPLPCEPILGIAVIIDQNYIDETFGNIDSALKKVQFVLNGAEKVWNDRLIQFNQKIKFHIYGYYYPGSNNSFPNECVKLDLQIYFIGKSLPGQGFLGYYDDYGDSEDKCKFNTKKGDIYIVNTKDNFIPDERQALVFAHELGHALGAGHSEHCGPNNLSDCLTNNFLMCGTGGPRDLRNVNWDECTWNQIRGHLNWNRCYCDPIVIPTCINCKADLTIIPDRSYVYLDCSNENEINLEISYSNDCDPKNIKLILGIQNGGYPTRKPALPKSSMVDLGDFTLWYHDDGVSYYVTDSLPYTIEQRRVFKCRIKLESGSNTVTKCAPGTIAPFVHPNSFNNTSSTAYVSYTAPNIMNNKNLDNLIADAPSCFFQNHTNCNLLEGSFRIQGTFTVNKDHCFFRSNIFMDPNAKIKVLSGKTLGLKKCHLKSCSSLWESIELESGAQLIIDTSTIEDANYAISRLGSGLVSINGSNIKDCNHGVWANNSSVGANYLIKNTSFNNISMVGIRIINGVASIFDCGFNNLSAGIVAENSNLNIGGNILEHIGLNNGAPPSEVYPWTGNGISLIGSGSELIKSISGQDGKLLNTLSDLNIGIFIRNGRYELDQVEVINASRAVSIHSSSTSGNIIKYLNSNTNKYGIFANDNAGMSALIDNNTIKVFDPDASGIYIGNNTGALAIKNNSIINRTGIAGVHFNGVSNAVLEKTSVLVETTNGTRSTGFYLNNSDNNVVKCNAIHSAAFGAGTTALEVRESATGSYLCNDLTGADCGLLFAGTCDPSSTGENTLSNHPLVGFVVSTPQNGSDGIIGFQYHKGNHLTGCSPNADAWNYGSFQTISKSKVKVSNPSPFKPNNISDLINLGFFLNPEDSLEYNCTNNNTCPYGIGRSKDQESHINVSTELINGIIGSNLYDDARTWSARKKILENIIRNNIRTSESISWMRIYKDTELFYYAKSSALLSILNIAELEYYKQELIYILDKINTFKPRTIYEQNQQVVSRIRIQRLQDARIFNISEITILKAIAEQCAYSGGNAVYEARMILEGIVKLDINEDESCGLRNKDNRILEEMKESMIAFPNPTSKSIHVRIINNDVYLQYPARIVSLDGRLIKNLILVRDNEIELTDIASGIYLIKVNDKPEWTTKIIVIK